MTGIITALHRRGFGSIQLDEDGRALFFCATLVSRRSFRPFRDLRVGDAVTVARIDTDDPRGPRAYGVRWLKDGARLVPGVRTTDWGAL
jgi:hypothetical protein